MQRLAIVSVLAACGSSTAPAIPRGRPTVQLVRCAPATPPPLVTDTIGQATAYPERRSTGFGSPRTVTVSARVGKRPVLSFGTVNVNGVISALDVARIAGTKHAAMLKCFGSTPLARLAMIYKFTIGADGVVSQVDTNVSGVIAPAIDGCIRTAFRSLRYPAKGATTSVTIPVIYDSTGAFAVPDDQAEPAIEPDPWTPFATGTRAPTATGVSAARATEAALRSRVGAIDKCFANPASTGSLRILLDLDVTGELSAVRAGGIGDKDAEACAAMALAGLHVMTPAQEHFEVACDLSRGDAAPWRVSPAAGYQVIEIDARGLKHGTDVVVPGVTELAPLPAETYVVVARPDTLGGMLQLALMWARQATAVVLSVGDGKSPPLYLGMGYVSSDEESGGEAVRPAIRVGKQFATGCIGRATHKAAVNSSTELGGLMQRLSARCRTLKCAPTMMVEIDSDATARDLLEVAGAARRAGFDRLLFGGAELSCSQEPKHKGTDSDLETFE